MKKIVPIAFVLICFFNVGAQVKIEGVVMDCETKESLPLVNVYFENPVVGDSNRF